MRFALAGLIFASSLFVTACNRQESLTGARLDAALADLVPQDTKALASIDLASLRRSPFYARHANELSLPMLDGMAQQTGFDPRRDLSAIVVIWNGKSLLVGGKGRFDIKALASQLKNQGTQTYAGSTILPSSSQSSLALISNQLVLAGRIADLKRALDEREAKTTGVPEAIRPKMAAMSPNGQIWAVSLGGLPFAEAPMRSDYSSALSNLIGYVSTTATSIHVDSGIKLRSQIVCVSEAGGKRVRDAFKGSIGLARLSTKDNQLELLKLWDAIQVDQAGQNVKVSADFSGELADQLIRQGLPAASWRMEPNH